MIKMDINIIGIDMHDGVSYLEKDSFTPEDDKNWLKIRGTSLFENKKVYLVTEKTNLDVGEIPPMKPFKKDSLYFDTDSKEFEILCSSNRAYLPPNKKNEEVLEKLAGLCNSDKDGTKITVWGTLDYNPKKKDSFSLFPHRIDFNI